jgi:DNA polymerase-3 subunit beta
MKFRAERDSLVEALGAAGRAVASRLAMPVLAGLLVSVTNNDLVITGTDGDLSIRVELEVIGVENGSAVIPAKLANDISVDIENFPFEKSLPQIYKIYAAK